MFVPVVVVTQHAQRLRRIILSSVSCPVLPYFSIFDHKRHDFRKKIIEHRMCVLGFCTNFVKKHFSTLKEFSELQTQMYAGTHIKLQKQMYTGTHIKL